MAFLPRVVRHCELETRERGKSKVLGEGRLRYEVAEWGKLPDGWALNDVAAVAVDSKDRVYVFNRGAHPMIVFDREGNFIRSWGEGLFSRAHGLHIGPDQNLILRLCSRFIPFKTDVQVETFFVRDGGVLYATPLFATLLVVEASDLIFAADSIPAVLAVSTHPFIVFSSNVFAILGLRALFFLISGFMEMFRHLRYGLAIDELDAYEHVFDESENSGVDGWVVSEATNSADPDDLLLFGVGAERDPSKPLPVDTIRRFAKRAKTALSAPDGPFAEAGMQARVVAQRQAQASLP